eukprot:TRINITY_DN121163_c0_g1_i1.p1 TRINITY_DN121163_c0_g1~~TRINITY_DN121163_c0_g1_i1.p1  ORF type:complete len:761 (+),score=138.39 TRINITY_DN121163_c0_g1_i1:142-2424(+)
MKLSVAAGFLAATWNEPFLVAAQRIKNSNLWVCPHCEKGVKSADVSDLSCEEDGAYSGGVHWPTVKQQMYRFLQSLKLPPEQRDLEELRPLLDLTAAPMQGECYLGVMSLGFLSFQFMGPDELLHFLQTSVFGGVPFKRAIPLSYWDVYMSGWPIFGLLASAAGTAQHYGEKLQQLAGGVLRGISGIDLSPRACCDYLTGLSTQDRDFLRALDASLSGFKWLNIQQPMSLQLPLRFLAESAHHNCSWGRATAYFSIADGMLAAPASQPSDRVLNSTRELFLLGEHNLDGCEPNTTVYHHMLSSWPFWQLLGRLEQRQTGLAMEASHPVGPLAAGAVSSSGGGSSGDAISAWSPPALPEKALRLKWRRTALRSSSSTSQPTAEASQASSAGGGASSDPGSACLLGEPGLAHIALSADIMQIDGLVVTLNSATINAGSNASRLCLHAFALPHQHQFVVDGLQCAFGGNMTSSSPKASKAGGPLGFVLRGTATLLVHLLQPNKVWQQVGLPAAPRVASMSADGVPDSVDLGDAHTRGALLSDTGNLGAVHNFVRFVLHDLLPALPRVVYLDVDVVVRGDLTELYDTAFAASSPGSSGDVIGSGATIAVVRRTHQPLRVYVDVLQPAMPGWVPGEAPSFNAGVMVIDLVRWRARGATALVAKWIASNREKSLWRGGSQPPLLLLFYDEVAPLEWVWNVDGLGHRLNYPKDVLRSTRILHWTGPLKPWRHHGVNRHLWEPYALEYCPEYSFREHTTTCRPDSWFC